MFPRAKWRSGLWFRFRRRRRLEAKNGFAFLHQIEFVARHRFEIDRIGLEQIHLPRLPGEQDLLIVYLALQALVFRPALPKFFVERQKQTDDDKDRGHQKQAAEDAVETLPDGGFTPRAEIAVTRIFH